MSVDVELFHRDTSNRHPIQQFVDLMREKSETLRTEEVFDEAARCDLTAVLSRRTLHFVQSPYFSPFKKAHVVSEVAANTQDEVLIQAAKRQLKHAFPVTGDMEKDKINARSRAEYAMAICATNQEVNFAEALTLAEVAGDKDAGEGYDDVIIRTEELKQHDLSQHRITEVQQSPEDNLTGDYADTVPWSPDDDDDDDPVIEAAMNKMVADIYNHHLLQSSQQVA